MSKILRFPFSNSDLTRISALQVDNALDATAANPGEPALYSMSISFRVNDDGAGPPTIQPLCPGEILFFHDDPRANRVLPEPKPNEIKEENYISWKTRGWLRIKPRRWVRNREPKLKELSHLYIWYGPIDLSKEFLFTTISHIHGLGLEKRRIKKSPNCKGDDCYIAYPQDNEEPAEENEERKKKWSRYAISSFLKGIYKPRIRLNNVSDPSEHDVVTKPMPKVVMDDRQVTLKVIATRYAEKPLQDGTLKDLDETTLFETKDPEHPKYIPVPAGHFYQSLKNRLVDPPASSDIEQKFFPRKSASYVKLRFTRTWKLIPNFSVHFPSQFVRVVSPDNSEASASNPVTLFLGRLPADGTVYVRIPPDQTIRHITVSLEGGMTYLRGNKRGDEKERWKVKASQEPIHFDLDEFPEPHIVVRRRLGNEMLVEIPLDINGAYCTYLSMRRFIRAFIDHRIAGGRLNHGVKRRSYFRNKTREVINEAINGLYKHVERDLPLTDGPEIEAQWKRSDRSHIYKNEIAWANNKLLKPIMELLFPEKVHPSEKLKGEVAFFLWHTTLTKFVNPAWRPLFDEVGPNPDIIHMGRGAAGAARYLGLADTYAFDASPDNRTDEQYIDYIVEKIREKKIKPGAVMNWNNNVSDFKEMTLNVDNHVAGSADDWTRPGKKTKGAGHSLVFLQYQEEGTDVKGIWVLDYFNFKRNWKSPKPNATKAPILGARWCPIDDEGIGRIKWGQYDGIHADAPRIWIAANWNE